MMKALSLTDGTPLLSLFSVSSVPSVLCSSLQSRSTPDCATTRVGLTSVRSPPAGVVSKEMVIELSSSLRERSQLGLTHAHVTPSIAQRDEIDRLRLDAQEQRDRATRLRPRAGEDLDALIVRERDARNGVASQPSITQPSNRHAIEAASTPPCRQLRASARQRATRGLHMPEVGIMICNREVA